MNYAFMALFAVVALLSVVLFVPNETTEQVDEIASDIETGVAPSDNVIDSKNTLDLSGQGLTKVPDSVFGQSGIEGLDLSNNNLDGALQAEIRFLTNLRVLDLSHNNFTGVPAEVGQLTKLEVLDLSDNPITGLPYEIGNLKNLKVLDLRGTNYAKQDLEVIKQSLSSEIEIRVDE